MTITEPLSDKELFQRIEAEDEAAFLELLHKYEPQVRPVILKLVKNESIVADLIQDLFLRIWLSRSKLPEIEFPRRWIFSIVYHQCFDYLRNRAVRDRHVGSLDSGEGSTPYHESPEAKAEFTETRDLIREAVELLPGQAKKVYMLRREQGYSIDQIAAELEIAPKTVKNTLTRALEQMRTHLKNKGIYLPVCLLLVSIYK